METKHNYLIDIYRFIVMTGIVLFHYTVRYNELGIGDPVFYSFTFNNAGTYGVIVFFIVSGFFMTKGILFRDGYGFRLYVEYLAQRYYRLWLPYFFACWIIFFWMNIFPIEGRMVPFGTFALDLVLFIHPGISSVDGAHWFLQALFVSQVIIGTLILIDKIFVRKIVLYLLCVLVFAFRIGIGPSPIQDVIKSLYLFEVLLGVVFFMAGTKDLFAVFFSIAGLIIIAKISIVLLIMVIIFAFLASNIIDVPDFMRSVYLKRIGNISFYWYLVHQNIGYSIQSLLVPKYCQVSLLWLMLPISITLLLAFLIEKLCSLVTPNFISKRLYKN